MDPNALAVQNIIDGSGEVLDRLLPAPEERALFVAGWRPTIGWICALALTWAFLLQPVALWIVATFAPGAPVPAIITDHLLELVLAMLGIAGLRTFEKTKAR